MANFSAIIPDRKVSPYSVFGAYFYIALLGFQLMRSLHIDTYDITQNRIDLTGYWIAFVISLLFGLKLLASGILMGFPLFIVGLLLNYICIIFTLTAPDESLIALMLSRYGLLMWFVLGIGFSAALEILDTSRIKRNSRYTRSGLLVVLTFFGIMALNYSQKLITEPVISPNYQSVAGSATIFLFITALAMTAVWGRKLPTSLLALYLGLGTVLAAAVSLTKSTLIVAVWLGCITVMLIPQFRSASMKKRVSIIFILLSGIALFFSSDLYQSIISGTRFSVFFTKTDNFTSLTSRFEILQSFWDQFSVSPIFGNYRAEYISGYKDYVHSVPFSFLTHTGLIGTALFFTAFYLFIRERTFSSTSGVSAANMLLGRYLWLVLAIGTISTFFTWSALWFLMGTLCARPRIDIQWRLNDNNH